MNLTEQVGALRRTLYRVLTRRLIHVTDCTFQQLVALKAIVREELKTQSELAERLLTDAPAVSRLVDRLEQDRLLRRTAGEDRRSVKLEVTPLGMEKVELLEEALRAVDKQLRAQLTKDELAVFSKALAKLTEALSADPDARP